MSSPETWSYFLAALAAASALASLARGYNVDIWSRRYNQRRHGTPQEIDSVLSSALQHRLLLEKDKLLRLPWQSALVKANVRVIGEA